MRTGLRIVVVSSLLALGCSDRAQGTASNEAAPSAQDPELPGPIPPESPLDSDAGASGSGSGGADGGLPSVPTPPTHVLAANLAIREIAVFQAVKVTIAKDGQEVDPSDTVHVIAGREGILRIYVEPGADWSAREVIAELTLVRDGVEPVELTATRTVSGGSEEADLETTLNVKIPQGVIEADTRYRVRLLTNPDQPAGDSSGAVFPAGGEAQLGAWDTGPGFRVKLVPVEVDGRIPDTSAAQLELYRQELYSMFPVRNIDLGVRDVFHYSGSVYAGGSGISALLGAITNLRQKDGAPDDEYYYGIFKAADTYSEYCSGGCTTGLCHLVTSASDTWSRACVGVGFKGASSAGTMAHELGHAHGLPHAPCGGPAGPDPNYPYYNAKIGSWGWDLRDDSLIAPSTRDFMSYCSPSWISDYNFDRITHRMSMIAQADARRALLPPEPASEWQTAEVTPDGSVVWREMVTLRSAPDGEPRRVVFERGGRDTHADTARFYPFSDLPGGTILIPKRTEPWDALRIANLGGRPSVRVVRR